jgi:uncharacterized protein YbjQ (UPF0145 family)
MQHSFILLASIVSLGGCAATALQPGAARVMVTKTTAPASCVYVGSVVGEQGGALTGKYTSNARLAEGAFNDMKNKAHALGANYVVLEDTQAGSTVSGDKYGVSGGQTDVTHIGNAFRCPDPSSSPPSVGNVAPPSDAPRPRAAADVVIVGS